MEKFAAVEVTAEQAEEFQALGLEIQTKIYVMVPDRTIDWAATPLALEHLPEEKPQIVQQDPLPLEPAPFQPLRDYPKGVTRIKGTKIHTGPNRSPNMRLRYVAVTDDKKPPHNVALRCYLDSAAHLVHKETQYSVYGDRSIRRIDLVKKLWLEYYPDKAESTISNRVTDLERAGYLVPVS